MMDDYFTGLIVILCMLAIAYWFYVVEPKRIADEDSKRAAWAKIESALEPSKPQTCLPPKEIAPMPKPLTAMDMAISTCKKNGSTLLVDPVKPLTSAQTTDHKSVSSA